MELNTLSPNQGAKRTRTRVGRGIGSGSGKTCGRGHKGFLARSGSGRKLGFEGGQMPLQRRLPKRGFSSYISRITDEIRLNELNNLDADVITIEVLRKAGLINNQIKHVKVISSGEIKKAVNLSGIRATKGAKEAIEKAGGKVA